MALFNLCRDQPCTGFTPVQSRSPAASHAKDAGLRLSVGAPPLDAAASALAPRGERAGSRARGPCRHAISARAQSVPGACCPAATSAGASMSAGSAGKRPASWMCSSL